MSVSSKMSNVMPTLCVGLRKCKLSFKLKLSYLQYCTFEKNTTTLDQAGLEKTCKSITTKPKDLDGDCIYPLYMISKIKPFLNSVSVSFNI